MKNYLSLLAVLVISCSEPAPKVEPTDGGMADTGPADSGQTGAVGCDEICARFDACESPAASCRDDCRATFAGACEEPCPWSQAAIDAFGRCVVDELTCEEIQSGSAMTDCYERIPIDDLRAERCERFEIRGAECAAGGIGNLSDRCLLLARTMTEEDWARTDGCDDAILAGDCAAIVRCINTTLEPSPPLEPAP